MMLLAPCRISILAVVYSLIVSTVMQMALRQAFAFFVETYRRSEMSLESGQAPPMVHGHHRLKSGYS